MLFWTDIPLQQAIYEIIFVHEQADRSFHQKDMFGPDLVLY